MAKSTGIVLTAGAISFGNDWWHSQTLNFRIPVATLAVALIFSGIDRIEPKAATGLAWIMLITVLFTPPRKGKAPLFTLGEIGKGK